MGILSALASAPFSQAGRQVRGSAGGGSAVGSGGPGGIGDSDFLQPAADGKAGHGSWGLQFGFYNHADGSGDGNPFLDEDLTVIEPVLVYDYNVTDRLGIGATLSYDYVSSASIDRLSEFPDQSGASGDNYVGGDFSMRYRTSEDWTLGAHAGFSFEYDYNSIGLGVNAIHTPGGTDSTISYSLDAYLDTVDIIRFDGTDTEGDDDRTSISGSVVLNQILSPRSIGTLGLSIAQQTGFLETPYNAVVIENPADPPNPNLANMARGTEVTEELPEDRFRASVFGSYRHSLGAGSAYELGGRLYNDSWGITSFTFEPSYFRTLVPDKLDMQLRYRYYNQGAADDFSDNFFTLEEFRTQDSDLGDYDTHTVGAKLLWYRGASSSFNLGLDYGIRSDGIQQAFLSFGWIWGF